MVHAGKFPGRAHREILTDQAIVIEAGKIVSVGPMAQANRPGGARMVDLPNATVCPASQMRIRISPATRRMSARSHFPYPFHAQTLTGARNARITLEAGFTTVRNVGADGFGDVALRDAINAGDVPGPRMLVSGPPLGITGGHCDENLLPFEFHYSSEGVGGWRRSSPA